MKSQFSTQGVEVDSTNTTPTAKKQGEDEFPVKASSLAGKSGSEPFPRGAWRSILRTRPQRQKSKERTNFRSRHRALPENRGQNLFHARRGGRFDEHDPNGKKARRGRVLSLLFWCRWSGSNRHGIATTRF